MTLDQPSAAKGGYVTLDQPSAASSVSTITHNDEHPPPPTEPMPQSWTEPPDTQMD